MASEEQTERAWSPRKHAEAADEMLRGLLASERLIGERARDPMKRVEDQVTGAAQEYNVRAAHTVRVATAHALSSLALAWVPGEELAPLEADEARSGLVAELAAWVRDVSTLLGIMRNEATPRRAGHLRRAMDDGQELLARVLELEGEVQASPPGGPQRWTSGG